jgi:hypothetical protein
MQSRLASHDARPNTTRNFEHRPLPVKRQRDAIAQHRSDELDQVLPIEQL